MNLKHLRLFKEIYITGSVTSAAQRLCVSQPAASKMLLNIEDEIGFKLFQREHNSLTPTPEAIILYEDILNVLQKMDQLEDRFRRAGQGAYAEINIASTIGAALGFLPEIIRRFIDSREEIYINLKIKSSSTIRDMVTTGQVDIGLTDIGLQSNRYHSAPVRMWCHCAIHKDHPQAHQPILNPELLGSTNWITFSPVHETYHQLTAAYQEYRVKFCSNLTVSSTMQALEMVNMNFGVSIAEPISCSKINTNNGMRFENVILRPFEPQIHEFIDIIWQNSRPMSQGASAILAEIRSEIAPYKAS